MKILIVDDNEANCLLFKLYLSRYGILVTAKSGIRAIELFKEALDAGQRFDFVCMDYYMPQMDGLEAVRAIRRIEFERQIVWDNRVKIAMVSVVENESLMINAYLNGCDAYITRPCLKKQFIEEIRHLGILPGTAA